MNPAKRMVEYVELTSIIAEDHDVPIKSMLNDAAYQSAFGCNLYMPCAGYSQFIEFGIQVVYCLKG